MSLTIACTCGQYYAVPPEYAGQQVNCPMCGALLSIPGEAVAPEETFSVTMPEEQALPVTVSCPCGGHYSAPAEFAGQQTACPACGRTLTIPAASTSDYHPTYPAPSRSNLAALLVVLLVVLLLAGGLIAAVLLVVTQPEDSSGPDKATASAGNEQPPAPAEPKEKVPPAGTPREEPKKEDDAPSSPPPPRPAPRPAPPSTLLPPSTTPWRGHTGRLVRLAFARDGRSILTAAAGLEERADKEVVAADSTLRRWDASSGLETARWVMSDSGVRAAAFSPDGRFAAVAGPGGIRVFLWDLDKKSTRHTLARHTRPVRCLGFSRDGRRLLSGGEDNVLVLWDVGSGKAVQEMRGHTNSPNQVAFSPDGKQALSCGMDHSARLWDLEAGRQTHELTGHADIVWACAYSPDGRFALTGGGMQHLPGVGLVGGGRDHDVRLWDAGAGKEQKRFAGCPSPVTALAVSPDGRRFLSGSHDGSVRLWQVESGKEVRRYEGHTGRVSAVAFFPGARRAISAGEDGSLRTWALPPDLPDLVRDLRRGDARARSAALAELTKLRQGARPAVPALFEALKRRDGKLRAGILRLLRDLSPLGKDHVLRLDRLLRDGSSSEERLFALESLTGLGADASPAASTVLAAVADKDRAVRRKALATLAPLVGDIKDKAFAPLLDALRDPDAEVSAGAEAALGKMGAPGVEHLATLRKLLREEQVAVRRYALRSLGELGERALPALAEIGERATKDPSPELRGLAATSLGRIAPRDKQTLDACDKALGDREVAVARLAAKVLANAEAVGPLIKAMQHADALVVKTAGDALDRAKFEPFHALLLVDLLDSKAEDVRRRGIEALGKLGADGSEGVPALCKVLKSAKPAERSRVLAALVKMGPAASKAGPTLAEMLSHKEKSVRFDACRALISIKAPEVKKAVPILIAALRPEKMEEVDDEEKAPEAAREREKVRDLLVPLGRSILKELVRALENDYARGSERTPTGVFNGVARLEIIRVLTAMGPVAGRNDVLLVLAAMQRGDPFSGVRKAAREARVKLQKKE
jgi:WD40 repeat protein/HEAT repeat protein